MENILSINDLNFIITSLEYTRKEFENTEYPSYEIKQSQLNKVNDVMQKVKTIKKQMNNNH